MSFQTGAVELSSLQDIQDRIPLRKSQERILELAEHSVRNGSYKEAVIYYEKVRKFLHNTCAQHLIEDNIHALLNDIEKKTGGGEEQQKPKPSQQPPQQEKEPEKPMPSPPDSGMSINIENITLSGVQVSAGEKAMEVFQEWVRGKQPRESLEQELSQEISYVPSEEENELPREPELTGMEKEIFNQILNQYRGEFNEAIESVETGAQIAGEAEEHHHVHEHIPGEKREETKTEKKTKTGEGAEELYSLSPEGEKIPYIEPVEKEVIREKEAAEKTDVTRKEAEAPYSLSPEGEKIPFVEPVEKEKEPGEEQESAREKLTAGKEEEPIKVEQVAPKKKVEKVNPISLTYKFTTIFHNKFYVKYADMFNEAARLVRERQLDEAIDYYKVLLDQRLPETMKMMIRQNIHDLEQTIMNTFKYGATIVDLDKAGKPRQVETDSIKIIEREPQRNDVYFEEES